MKQAAGLTKPLLVAGAWGSDFEILAGTYSSIQSIALVTWVPQLGHELFGEQASKAFEGENGRDLRPAACFKTSILSCYFLSSLMVNSSRMLSCPKPTFWFS